MTSKYGVTLSNETELYLPKAWNIDDKTNVFLGGISEKNKNDKITTNTLTLVGDINFSGVEIIYI